MNDILVLAGLVAGWIVLNVWILPLFGIQTCMSGACRVPRVEHAESCGTRKAGNENQAARELEPHELSMPSR